MHWLYGLLDLPLWSYVVVTAVMVHFTVVGVTLYLHRDQTHRGLDLHPVLQHVFRFWLWLTTGMVTREWVAVHRKHHAHCETPEDPHSPQILGLAKVFFEGAELYRAAANDKAMVEKYGRGAPDDWLERHLYTRHNRLGIGILMAAELILLGLPGLTVWAIQMMAIPVMAAGVVNGVGHYFGYRNFECKDAATNVVPWGILLGGEELHNNHHAFPSSAKFALRPWELDIGWLYIKALRRLGLAKVRRVAPRPQFDSSNQHVDLETVRAIIVNRLHVLRDYTLNVTLPVLHAEAHSLGDAIRHRTRKLFVRDNSLLDKDARTRLGEILDKSQSLRTVYEFRQRLQILWESSTASNERLIQQVREWCHQAEASGIEVLEQFATRLRGYAMQPLKG